MQNGIDLLLTQDFGLKGKRLGLITNPTGLSSSLVSTIDILRERFELKALFGPEHGVRGEINAEETVESYQDSRTGLPVYSLYKKDGENSPDPKMLEGIDLLVMDVQDSGCRFFTFISTMYKTMEVCAAAAKVFVILDRLNPINGIDVEGNIPDPAFKSFVGIAQIPQRHGMTMGELALFFNQEAKINCELAVVPISAWRRNSFADETGIPWVQPSTNIPSVDAALLFGGTCFFEGTNISEGRGTTKPFEMIGAPFLDAEALADSLNTQKNKFPGIIFRPVYFKPFSGKFQGELCRGVQLHITDRQKVRPVSTGLELLHSVQEQAGDKFVWLPPKDNGKYFIDLLAGTDILRLGRTQEYLESVIKGAQLFEETRQSFLLY